MTNVSIPRAFGRTTVAAGAAALLALGLAAPAAADNAVRAQYTGTTGPDRVQITMDGQNVGATMFQLTLEGGDTLGAYCIDLETSTRNNAWYVEDAWANYPGKGDFTAPGKVHWILQNSYPTVPARTLGQEVDLPRLSEADAMAATQAAIWHFTNGADLGRAPGNVTRVYRHLVDSAQDLPQEPGPSLTVTPGSAEGEAGSRIGGFTIETSAASVPVTVQAPEGVELVDLETGEAVSAVENGDKVGFEVPAGTDAGEASFTLETTAEVSAGRLFKGEDPDKPTQTLITAKTEEVTVSASASATWTAGGGEEPSPEPTPSEEPTDPEPTPGPTPEPTPSEEPGEPASPKPTPPGDDRNEPSLPVTGGALAGLVAAGIAALGAGGGAIYLSRKRKAASGQE
ncbi:thioester domain-containing protein [Nocardiopsis flavescens]|uniref:thioester domain-containing protein n=1 Tax=Nocardiopsis flavescens TaxID=758803 RepID=UPI0036560F1A